MVHKKYIKRGGKTFGPYYYENYRVGDKIKTRYLGQNYSPQKKSLSYKNFLMVLVPIALVILLLAIGNFNYYFQTTGNVIDEIENPTLKEVKIAEKIATDQLSSTVDIQEISDLNIKDKLFEKNKIMEFQVPEGLIELNFDLLNYSEFIEKQTEQEVDAENFDIEVDESAEKYKWGYEVKLTDLNFMARIDVSADAGIVLVDDQTLKIGNNYLSFADLIAEGYTLTIEEPVILEKLNITNQTFANETITNITLANETLTNITITNVTEGNILIINETTANETITNITEEVEGIEEQEEIPEVNITEEETSNETEIIINETEVDTNITEELEEEQNETSEEEEQEEQEEENKETTEEVEAPNQVPSRSVGGPEEGVPSDEGKEPEEEISISLMTGSVEKTESEDKKEKAPKGVPSKEGKEKKEKEKKKTAPKGVPSDEGKESAETPITGKVIRGITGFFVHGIQGMTGNVVEEEKVVSIYIQRNFNNTNYSIGDIIYLDPTLVIIEISDAEHLDENRTLIADIYDSVKELDGNYSPVINNNEYVRITFKENLTNTKDITVYARAVNESSEIEVYLENGNESIAKFKEILNESYYKVYLTNLSENDSYQTFDLKVLGAIEFDYIVDPSPSGVDMIGEYYPANDTNTSGIGTIMNFTFNHTTTDNYTAMIFVSNTTSDLNTIESLVYISNSTIRNNTLVEYNLTALPVKSTLTDTSILLHMNNQSEFGEDDELVYDFTGEGHSATCSSSTCPSFDLEGGKVAGGFEFDGVDDRLTITKDSNLHPTNNFSIQFWMNPDSTGTGSRTIIDHWLFCWNGYGYFFQIVDGALSFATGGGFITYGSTDYPIEYDRWTLVTGTFENGNISLYLDGEYKSSGWQRAAAADGLPIAEDIWFNTRENMYIGKGVGSCWEAVGSPFKGNLDEIAFFDHSLTPAEVYDYYWQDQKYYWQVNMTNGIDSNLSEIFEFDSHGEPPMADIVSPTPWGYYDTSVIDFNMTAIDVDEDVDSCWYSLDDGSAVFMTNTTSAPTVWNATDLTVTDGNHLVKIYCNDTVWGNIEEDFQNFTVDLTYPTINITHPLNITYNYNVIDLNYTFIETNPYNCWYSTDSGITNTTITCGDNVTGLSSSEGSNTWTVWANDTVNNVNSSSATFVVDTIYPEINLTSPLNQTYNYNVTDLNYTFTNSNPDSCWYSLDSGITNTTITCGDNVTGLSSSEGSNTWTVWANDTVNNVNSSSVTFFVDSIFPELSITYPLNTTYNSIITNLNYTFTNSNPDSCWYSNDSGLTNTTITCGDNVTGLSSSEGSNTWTVWINDTVNNVNSSSVTFFVDTIYPIVRITSPINGTYGSNKTLHTNYTFIETNIDSCWYTNDSMTTNVSLGTGGLCTNITSVTWSEGQHNLTIWANDTVNNVNSSSVTFFVDSTPPTVNITSPVNATIYTSASVTFQTATNENSTCNYTIDGGLTNSTMSANSTGTGFVASQALSNAVYTSQFYCRDILGNLNDSTNVTFTVAVPDPVLPAATTGGSGGGGGSAIIADQEVSFDLDKESYEKTIVLHRNEFDTLAITNNWDIEKTFTISANLEELISFEEQTIIIPAGETKEFEFKLSAPKETGTYAGKITITSGTERKEIPVVIMVRTEKSLFDIIVSIPIFMKTLSLGENVNAQIDLLQMGIREKMDVTLHYEIKDFEDKIYFSESETIAVTDQKTLSKEFFTQELPAGDYVLAAELIYPDGVAVASSQFKVKEEIIKTTWGMVAIALTLAIIIIFVIMFLAIKRYKRIGKQILKKRK